MKRNWVSASLQLTRKGPKKLGISQTSYVFCKETDQNLDMADIAHNIALTYMEFYISSIGLTREQVEEQIAKYKSMAETLEQVSDESR